MARRVGLHFDITDDDIAYARRENRWNCAAVRAIQRVLPEATHVMVDKDHIRFSLRDDGTNGTRYEFETPDGMVNDIIKPFDQGGEVPERSFNLTHAVDAWDMKKTNRAEQIEKRTQQRTAGPRRGSIQVRGGHHNSAFNRFPPEPAADDTEGSGGTDQQ